MAATHQLNGIMTVRCSVGLTMLSSHSHHHRLPLVVPQVVSRKCLTNITVLTLVRSAVHPVLRISSLSLLEEIGCKQGQAQTPRVPCHLK